MTERPWIIGIAGGSGAGKTTFARRITQALGSDACLHLSQDSYYIDQSASFTEDGGDVNFDDPAALEFTLLEMHLQSLRQGHSVDVPVYDFPTHTRASENVKVLPAPVILVDGTLILSEPAALTVFDVRVFIDIPEDVRFARRLHRDTRERGRTLEGVKAQWDKQVKPMHDRYVQPGRVGADYVISDDASWERSLQELVSRLAEAPTQ